jgi:hypothetical protein
MRIQALFCIAISKNAAKKISCGKIDRFHAFSVFLSAWIVRETKKI